MINALSKINNYIEQKRYQIILNDRKHLTDYEKDQLIPEIRYRLSVLKEYFNDIVLLCDTLKDSPVFSQAVQAVINPRGFTSDPNSPQETLAEKFFSDIKRLTQKEGIDEIDKMSNTYKVVKTVKEMGMFFTEVNNFCSSLAAINNKLLLYKIEAYPYLTNVESGQVIATAPTQYTITVEPFQILVSKIVGVSKATSDTIHEWHKYAMKLKSQYLDLYTQRLSIRNTKWAFYIHLLAIILAISLSALFLLANDPFNLYKENKKLKNEYSELENRYSRLEIEYLKLKNIKK